MSEIVSKGCLTFTEMFIAYLLSRNQRMEAESGRSAVQPQRKAAGAGPPKLSGFRPSRKKAILPKISQETLAEMVGTTPSRVCFFEQISPSALHRLQRLTNGQKVPDERDPTRLTCRLRGGVQLSKSNVAYVRYGSDAV